MPLITDIKPQKRKERFNIYLDGKFAFGVSAEALVKAGLEIDKEIDKEKTEELIKEDDYIKVLDQVLKFFSYRPRSTKELTDWFKRKEIGVDTQAMISEKLTTLGYLNDEEFAKWWVEQRQTFRPRGSRLLKQELWKKGISNEIIETLVMGEESKDEVKVAREMAAKKMRYFRNLPDLELKQKLGSFLARKGFSWEIVKQIIDENIKRE